MPELVGYLDRWSALPGESVSVYLASDILAVVSLDLLRLGRGESRTDVGGIAFECVDAVAPRTLEVMPRRVDAGSFAEIGGLARLELGQGALAMLVQPWTVGGAEQTVLALEAAEHSLSVVLDTSGSMTLRNTSGATDLPDTSFASASRTSGTVAGSGWRTVPRRWVVVHLAWTRSIAELAIETPRGQPLARVRVTRKAAAAPFDHLRLAGAAVAEGTVGSHFDGRLERPVLWPVAVDTAAARVALLSSRGLPPHASACWDFSQQMDSQHIVDIGALGLHGRLCQGPKRAVRGARWRGDTFDWRQAPEQYAAIHFHRDDLTDAGWPTLERIELPATLPSGAYALRARCAGDPAGALTLGQVRLPLFVRARPAAEAKKSGDGAVPAGETSRAGVAVVFPTFTYLAYGNDRSALFGHNPEVLAACAISLEPTEVLLSRHPEWGLSLYDSHHDESGVSLASRWRPIPTLQPDQRAWQAGEGSGRWNYPADLLLVEWLEREGFAWHALTDEDLHLQGAAALAPYRVVLTGNHPEYATPQLIDSYRHYLDTGGRLMYLGGNGFYWKIACSDALPGVIELRRAEDGNRSWAEEPGEYYHALDGGYGGLWRRNGLPPQSWLGVGYSGQGFRRSIGYRRAADSDRPEVAFVFEGVPQRDFGEQGVIGGGCAGIEVDRRDVLLGADPAGFLLASSQPFDSTYLVANEELLVSRPTLSAEFSTSVRADVVLQHTAAGGAVFCTGSIAWMGGLAAAGGDAAVQRITKNVLMRFLNPTALPQRKEPDAP